MSFESPYFQRSGPELHFDARLGFFIAYISTAGISVNCLINLIFKETIKMNTMKETYLTSTGLNELQEKLHELKTIKRREIADAIHSAKEQGDLSENAEYVNAKEEQNRIEQQIAELEVTLKNARIITKSNTNNVDVGNTVTLMCDGLERVYQIVGSNEADPVRGKISNESPMGEALLMKKKGDRVSIPTPVGAKDCEIIKIS